MASITYSTDADTGRGEARFFFTMACVMAATIIGGFSLNLAMGRSSFSLPWLVQFHAWVFMGFLGLYLLQNYLVFSDNVALHRRLGWLSVVWIPAMVVMGLLVHRWSLQDHGGPPFFDMNEFLISNPLQLLVFAGLAGWAVTVRANTGWHRRLMYCAFATLTGPGLGRLLPMPYLIPYGWRFVIGVTVLFPVIGMIADQRRYGRVHPAWLWGVGAVLAMQVVADLIAYSATGLRFTDWFVAGTPGAARPMAAFMPPP